MKNKIVISHGHTSIEVLHSMLPFILASRIQDNKYFEFVDYRFSNLFKKNGDLLILIRKYHDGKTSNDNIVNELIKLRKNFTKIVYFDDSAAASVIFFCAFPYVDEYWKRSIFNDLSNYKNKFYGGHLFSHYYHKKFNIDDGSDYFINPILEKNTPIEKLKVSWNIGIGIYPVNQSNIYNNYYPFMRRFLTSMIILPSISPLVYFFDKYLANMKCELKKEINFKKKIHKFSSRFSSASYRRSVGFQRNLFIELTANDKSHLTGYKNKKDFIRETFEVFGVLSPFGWGEICYRDFETIIGGALLIKPNMCHLKTWPDIYQKNYYFPINWDLSNFRDLELLFDQTDFFIEAIYKSREVLFNALNDVTKRCITMIDKVL